MGERPSPMQIRRLRRLRLVRAQRDWRALASACEQLRKTCAEFEGQCASQRDASARCLRHAEAGAPSHALTLRQAAAHERAASNVARRHEAASMQLAALAPRLRAARAKMELAKRLLEALPLR